MTTAIVLSGGGAKGDFQVGALKFLYERRIQPNIICGTSVGAINGAVLAEGPGGLEKLEKVWLNYMKTNGDMYQEEGWYRDLKKRFPEMEELFSTTYSGSEIVTSLLFPPLFFYDHFKLGSEVKDFKDAIDNIRKYAKSLYNLSPIEMKMRSANPETRLEIEKIHNSGIKLRLAVVSLESGELKYVTETGMFGTAKVDLIDAVLASAAIPGIFTPKKLLNENCVDGGVRDIVPIQVAIDLGADKIFAIVCSKAGVHPNRSYDDKNLIDIALRAATEIMPDEIQKSETNPPRGWGADVKIIQPSFEVHDTMTINPDIIKISIDYGYMRASDVIEPSRDPQDQAKREQFADAITKLRMDMRDVKKEPRFDDGRPVGHEPFYKPRPEPREPDKADPLLEMKNTLKDLVDERKRLGGAVPSDINTLQKTPSGPEVPPARQFGIISGKVVDSENGFLIIGARVTAGTISKTTDSVGKYILSNIPTGQVLVSVRAARYDSSEKQATVPANQIISVDFSLDKTVKEPRQRVCPAAKPTNLPCRAGRPSDS